MSLNRKARYGILILIAACAVLSLHASNDFQRKCLSFNPEAFVDESTRQVLEYVPAGTNLTFPDNDPTCERPNQVVVVDLCRVALFIPTSRRSGITYELWLPAKWSGRLLGTGNGGIDGCIKYEDIAYTTQHGFASFGSNNGHNGTSGVAFYQNPDVVTDFAWRSLHTGVLVGKKLTKQFYKKPHHKSYFLGCSQGGRQGIKSAEMFPEDFDGVVAGAPAVDYNNLVSWRASFFPITGPLDSPDFINASTWSSLIHNEVLNQCDKIDGVADNIIEDPDLCQFRPETLACPNNETVANCLTPAQVAIVRKIFTPLYNNENKLIYPAMQPGSEIMAAQKLYAGKAFAYSEDWFKYVIYTPSWDPFTFAVHDALIADSLNPSNIRTWPLTLSSFHKPHQNAPKILLYHGAQDPQISIFNTQRFYNRLATHRSSISPLSPPSNHNSYSTHFTLPHPPPLDSTLRFFRISGMSHCNSGPGAWIFGQGGGNAAAGVLFHRKENILKACVDWVEGGVAPETIEGQKGGKGKGRRRHCRYPKRNTYVGGDPENADSWKCVDV